MDGFGTNYCYSCGKQHKRNDMVTDEYMGFSFKRGYFCKKDPKKMRDLGEKRKGDLMFRTDCFSNKAGSIKYMIFL